MRRHKFKPIDNPLIEGQEVALLKDLEDDRRRNRCFAIAWWCCLFPLLALAIAGAFAWLGVSNANTSSTITTMNSTIQYQITSLQMELATIILNIHGGNTTILQQGSCIWGLLPDQNPWDGDNSTLLAIEACNYTLQNVAIGGINFNQLLISPPEAPLLIADYTPALHIITANFDPPVYQVDNYGIFGYLLPLTSINAALFQFNPACGPTNCGGERGNYPNAGSQNSTTFLIYGGENTGEGYMNYYWDSEVGFTGYTFTLSSPFQLLLPVL